MKEKIATAATNVMRTPLPTSRPSARTSALKRETGTRGTVPNGFSRYLIKTLDFSTKNTTATGVPPQKLFFIVVFKKGIRRMAFVGIKTKPVVPHPQGVR